MKTLLGAALLTCLAAGVVYGQGGMRHGMGMHGGGATMHGPGSMMGASMLRHRFVHQHGIDAQYRGKTNPLGPSDADVDAGGRLYAQQCAQCHGATGHGDTDAAATLNPPPADLTVAAKLPMADDAYLYWTIAEGGAPIGSAMPPYKAVLDETQIWQLISYLRRL
jgi:cytochrome c553